MQYKPLMKTDIKVPEILLVPISVLEFEGSMRGWKSITEDFANEYMKKFGDDVSAAFNVSYLYQS